MSARSFRSVFMVASCAGAALGCYLVSLRVASERAQLEQVENRIVVAQGDMRVLQTEIGTRGRLSQLERWNAGAFALSAPAADQFLKGSFELAKLTQPERRVDFKAPVYLASAPAPQRPSIGAGVAEDSDGPAVTGPDVAAAGADSEASSLLHQASLKTETREVPARTIASLPRATAISMDKPATAAKPVSKKSVEKPGLAAAHHSRAGEPKPRSGMAAAAKVGARKSAATILARNEVEKPALAASRHLKSGDPKSRAIVSKAGLRVDSKKSVDKVKIVTAKALTKPVHMAKVDPLAPLPAKHSGHSKDVSAD